MKKLVISLVIVAYSPFVLAANGSSSDWKEKYHAYAQAMGDATPIGMNEWGVANGYLPDTSRKERVVLSAQDQAHIAREMGFGDATMPTTSVSPGLKERVQITPLDREHIDFTSSYGDGTPPSYSDWLATRKSP